MTRLKANLDRHGGRPANLTTEQFKFWIKNKNLKRHQFETPLMVRAIQKKLKMGYYPEDLLKVIENYSRLEKLGQAPGYGEWGLTECMRNCVYFDNLLDDKWPGFTPKPTGPNANILTEDYGLMKNGWSEE